ncbi:hypothetical protein HanRHA438_Chr16g0778571 [Helianthus annuus]|nr:hypothetical protein HanRHA438_Chr16g0778571 [Helianthus annuus]
MFYFLGGWLCTDCIGYLYTWQDGWVELGGGSGQDGIGLEPVVSVWVRTGSGQNRFGSKRVLKS